MSDQIAKMLRVITATRGDICTCCSKQDVEEVEQTIAVIMALLQDVWVEQMIRAYDDVLLYLERATQGLAPNAVAEVEARRILGQYALDDRLSRTALGLQMVDYVLRLIRRGADTALQGASERAVEAAGERLLLDGALAVAGSLSFSHEPVDVLLRPAAVEDLRQMLRGHSTLREGEIRKLVGAYLDDPRLRSTHVVVEPGSAQERSLLTGPPTSREAFRAQLERAVGVDTAVWLNATVDAWAYRWFNVGRYRTLRQQGITVIYAQAVLDERTTPFCRWVDGRRINIAKADSQLRRYVHATTSGDDAEMRRVWPLLTRKEIQAEPEDFSRMFSKVGLPPYHFRCRTIPVTSHQ